MTNESENPIPNDNQQAAGENDPVLEFPSAEEIDQIANETSGADVPVDEATQLREQLADAEKRVLMAHADLDNFRRRNLRETQDQIKYAPGKLMTEILEAIDNLGRAVESYEKDKNGDGLNDGVKMVAAQEPCWKNTVVRRSKQLVRRMIRTCIKPCKCNPVKSTRPIRS